MGEWSNASPKDSGNHTACVKLSEENQSHETPRQVQYMAQVTEVELWSLAPYPATSSCSLPSSLSITDVELKGDVALWSVIVRIATPPKKTKKKPQKQNKYNHII